MCCEGFLIDKDLENYIKKDYDEDIEAGDSDSDGKKDYDKNNEIFAFNLIFLRKKKELNYVFMGNCRSFWNFINLFHFMVFGFYI